MLQVDMKTLYVGILLTILYVCGGLARTDDDRSRSRDNRNAEGSSNSSDGTATSRHTVPLTMILASFRTMRLKQASPTLPLAFFITVRRSLDYVEHSVPAVELAVEKIHANRSILPNYELSYNLKEIEVTT